MPCTKMIKLTTKISKPMTLEEVFKQYERFLHRLVQKWDNTYEHEELFQVASVGLIKTYKSYDINKGFIFMTYLGRVVNNEILMFNRRQRKYNSNKSMETVIHVDFDGNDLTLSEVITDEINYEEMILDKIDRENLPGKIRILLNSLNEREKDVITCMFFKGLNQGQISKRLGISQSYISRLIQRSLKKMKNNYEQKKSYKSSQ
ncbi:RNA polymerase sigma-28 factor [Clostridium pasteurianum DSM 525 = ATCC 6013]|uniref:RNA polymerase sigma-28 factor n=1 Tax=Clostridium pasteurianum DSM 525 = ATCC 6013 TaxID=1262449 RepID=A0A0H3JB18_CLOPA|nr:sigma-70 family RNA polymerase sigma factor [Clostridium pasteurianum]AJA50088.1 RNA polymerase sigma-28 factor [Clostridium pasteurianum DSM 525 = ATCC 6013]AJA54076.1 RNA polymerase sigma-28 factor [Clostridium pasteurianum DSM 525 = ATCC 6013]AOZ77206.1 hypothetical protein AQ983_19720 [Clostridium pasteurianum DSM 525 = ATCC 6013]AOZ81002.1 hypothetical protein AQ984_19715 [Clostridium pasteurianum]ELP59211.1 RNA polymerase sporulation specific sigma factor SigE [Clostridium pasteurianu